MKHFLTFIFMMCIVCTLCTQAKADGITFTNATVTFAVPSGFVSAPAINPKWLYFTHSSGAGIRLMTPMSSTLLPDANGNVEYFWSSQLTSTPFEGVVSFVASMTICSGTDCAPAVFSGSLAYGADGLRWVLQPPAQTIALGSQLYHLAPAHSTRVGVSIPRDAAFRLVPAADVPEPASLTILGTGLAGLAAGLRRRKKA